MLSRLMMIACYHSIYFARRPHLRGCKTRREFARSDRAPRCATSRRTRRVRPASEGITKGPLAMLINVDTALGPTSRCLAKRFFFACFGVQHVWGGLVTKKSRSRRGTKIGPEPSCTISAILPSSSVYYTLWR